MNKARFELALLIGSPQDFSDMAPKLSAEQRVALLKHLIKCSPPGKLYPEEYDYLIISLFKLYYFEIPQSVYSDYLKTIMTAAMNPEISFHQNRFFMLSNLVEVSLLFTPEDLNWINRVLCDYTAHNLTYRKVVATNSILIYLKKPEFVTEELFRNLLQIFNLKDNPMKHPQGILSHYMDLLGTVRQHPKFELILIKHFKNFIKSIPLKFVESTYKEYQKFLQTPITTRSLQIVSNAYSIEMGKLSALLKIEITRRRKTRKSNN